MRAVLLMVAMAGQTWGAAPPAALTVAQERLLGERDARLRQGLEAWEAGRLGERHADYAISLNNLAAIHKDMGRHRAALILLRRAMAKAKELRGTPGLRGAGKASEVMVSGKKERRSPIAWWAAWQLSGDWR